jgi:hypothetical protein
MGRLLASIETLDGTVGSLRGSLEPIGRIADRVPGKLRHPGRHLGGCQPGLVPVIDAVPLASWTESESTCEVVPQWVRS